MNLKPMVRVQAVIELDDQEADVLNTLTSYGLAEWFSKHCSAKYPPEQIAATLRRIRNLTAVVIRSRERAAEVILAHTLSPIE